MGGVGSNPLWTFAVVDAVEVLLVAIKHSPEIDFRPERRDECSPGSAVERRIFIGLALRLRYAPLSAEYKTKTDSDIPPRAEMSLSVN
jgi:hypothetical protein